MVGVLSCFGCGSSPVPPDHIELTRDELKNLYHKSISINKGRLIVHGIFARADTKNNNKRVYPKYILKREVGKYEREHIHKGTALGELDHPNYASRYFKCLNLANVSHQVLEVLWKGDQLWGSIEILPTPSGLLLWELYSQGIKLGVSSRGWASLKTDAKAQCVYVDDDFELITFDFVTEPSTKGAYLVPVRKPYKPHVTNQSKCVQIAHLGHGVISMHNINRLPEPHVLVNRINHLQTESKGVAVRLQGLVDPASPGSVFASVTASPSHPASQPHKNGLDRLLLYSHYIVFQEAAYLDREQHARDFRAHLAMFATRAHLSDQQALVNRADLNALILQEFAPVTAIAEDPNCRPQPHYHRQLQQGSGVKPCANGSMKESREHAYSNDRLDQQRDYPECQSRMSPCDLNAWSMHPNALDLPSGEPEAARSRQGQYPPSVYASPALTTPPVSVPITPTIAMHEDSGTPTPTYQDLHNENLGSTAGVEGLPAAGVFSDNTAGVNLSQPSEQPSCSSSERGVPWPLLQPALSANPGDPAPRRPSGSGSSTAPEHPRQAPSSGLSGLGTTDHSSQPGPQAWPPSQRHIPPQQCQQHPQFNNIQQQQQQQQQQQHNSNHQHQGESSLAPPLTALPPLDPRLLVTPATPPRPSGPMHPRSRDELAAGGIVGPPPLPQQPSLRVRPGVGGGSGRGLGPQPQPLILPSEELSLEFQRIKVTLSSFAGKYQTQQAAMMRTLGAQLPLPSDMAAAPLVNGGKL